MIRFIWQEMKNDRLFAFAISMLACALIGFIAMTGLSIIARENERSEVWQYTQGDVVVYAKDNPAWHTSRYGNLRIPTENGVIFMSPQFGPIQARRVK